MRFWGASWVVLAFWGAPVLAGDEVLYDTVPDWIEPVDIASIDQESNGQLVLLDVEQRIEDGRLVVYSDQALKLDSPEALTAAGTTTAIWMPDKGDLTAHHVDIIRGDETIHVLDKMREQGKAFTVLRREQQLERRTMDGMLTATMAVPDLRLGDILRVVTSVSLEDQALGGNVQATQALFAKPVAAAYGRVTFSWPEGENIHWQAGPRVEGVEEHSASGYHEITLPLPLPEREDMPGDAPMRYLRPPILQATTFDSWEDISRVFAPLYDTQGLIAAGDPIDREVQRIMADSEDPLKRAALAVQQVQDDISYLMNGMSGGNYVPQTPAETWEKRYGDCKAKSLLLLAMLRAMDIDAEAVLVSSSIGDALPDMLPMPADFDHVIIHARIGGQSYWLDGTSGGTRIGNIDQVLPFFNGLPLRREGAGLEAIEQNDLTHPNITATVELDQTAGIDMPTLYRIEFSMGGAMAAQARPVALQGTEDMRRQYVETLVGNILDLGSLLDPAVSYDNETAILKVTARGSLYNEWSFDESEATYTVNLLDSNDINFNPDRARALWRDIPVSFRIAPLLSDIAIDIDLPKETDAYRMRGRPELEMGVANVSFHRAASLSDNRFSVTETMAQKALELPAEAISAEKARAARLKAMRLRIEAPHPQRIWELNEAERDTHLAALRAFYTDLVASDPEEAEPYMHRAYFRDESLDFAGTAEDLIKLQNMQPTADRYLWLARIQHRLGKDEAALDAAREAFTLEPVPANALAEAVRQQDLGNYDEALALVDDYIDLVDDDSAFLDAKSEILGRQGDPEAGLALITARREEEPDNIDIQSLDCWYRAKWQTGMADMLDICTRLVERSSQSALTLDSRGLAYYRLGNNDAALADFDKALKLAPAQHSTRYLRGIVRLAAGDQAGREDIRQALRAKPELERDYAYYGLTPE
ncbi:DUF3857 domain-containing protein [Altericroceibacterium spongiae]|uniref:DUF3857 domain-containing protein n=1 Tax=Altericroceibacterium spongiae TaxID=2320269 RepID=A0A420EDX0_9SPHN|nr:DUF3857 domain-containing protein [Altericroceibacterium spongiae]RKF18929.1 DUF3857 domain-containing protein [Altericroceibacterium spongiae]